MKATRTFWHTVVAGIAMVVLGYFGFLAFMPDKTSIPFVPLLCFLIFTSGAVVLVGSLGFAVTKILAERRHSKGAGE